MPTQWHFRLLSCRHEPRRQVQKSPDGVVTKPLVVLESPHHQGVSRRRSRGFPGIEPQPGPDAGAAPAEQIDRLSKDAALRARVDTAHRELKEYLDEPRTWASIHAAPLRVRPVAYFSAEFGIHESLPIYSGGLGVLAGDHLKSASDLGLPLVAVGLFYRESYFRQRIDREGHQHAEWVRSPAETLPTAPARTPGGKPIVVEIPISASETLLAQVWEVRVGRNQLLLLDTDVDGNTEDNRQLSARLYFGDQRIRSDRSCCSASAASGPCTPPEFIGGGCI